MTFTWDFGDGSAGAGTPVVHTYPLPGTYTAIVTAANRVSSLTATTEAVVRPPVRVYLPLVVKGSSKLAPT